MSEGKSKIKRVVVFETSDGKKHDGEIEARTHEVQIDAKFKLMRLLQVSFSTGRSESVVNQIILESEAIRKILADMKMKLPKKKKEKEAA